MGDSAAPPMSRSAKKSPKKAVSVEGMYDVENQVKGVRFSVQTGIGGPSRKCFTPWLASDAPEGRFPTVLVSGAPLANVGKAGENKRGIAVYEFAVAGQTKHSSRIALMMDPESQLELRSLLTLLVSKLSEAYSPIHKSTWYQDSFPALTDGTKVFTATSGLQAPENFVNMTFEDDENKWDSPSKTWAPFMYGSDVTAGRWYPRIKIGTGTQVHMFNTKNKAYGRVTEDGHNVYPGSAGVTTDNANILRTMLGSEHYQRKQWTARTMIQVTGVEFKCGQVGVTAEGNPRYGISPVFHLRTIGPMALQEVSLTTEAGGITEEQRVSAMTAVIFKDLPTPTRKRKSRDAAPLFNHPKKKTPSIPDSDISDIESTIASDGEDA